MWSSSFPLDICVCACEACRRWVHGRSPAQSLGRSAATHERAASFSPVSTIIKCFSVVVCLLCIECEVGLSIYGTKMTLFRLGDFFS